MRRLTLLPAAAALGSALLLAAACGGGENTAATEPAAPTDDTTAPATAGSQAQAAAQGVDPRQGGFEIALGEWTLTPEAESIRPGRATFVITNRGMMPHGFEIKREDGDDSSGNGSGDDGDKVETRVLQPGESVSVDLDLSEGVYKLECKVDGHDDMGMEMLFEVKKGAPLAKKAAAAAAPQAGQAIAADIRGFVFEPAIIQATAGQKVTWTNHDPAQHTVTQEGGGFDSGTMAAANGTFTHTFDQPGEYRYICALHPGMKGNVVVTG